MKTRVPIAELACCLVALTLLAGGASPVAAEEASGYHPTFASPHADPIAVSPDRARVYVANTGADTLDILDASDGALLRSIPVGIDPVGVAVRPDGKEVWVANHVSDTVSVINTEEGSPGYHQVVATVTAWSPDDARVTAFDEPVGVAFASNAKAYVTLSSTNHVAVVDVARRAVTGKLLITAQDPRALRVRGDRLYVVAFESGNQTQLSGCIDDSLIDGETCTFNFLTHVVLNNNVLSYGYLSDIIREPRMPDRDLFVFDTTTDELVDQVETIGTLLYGVAVDSTGQVFIAQTEARNDSNGRAGTLQHGLAEMENRAFLNQIARVDCSGESCAGPELIELEPLPPLDPAPGEALATPYAIAISGNDKVVVATAASSDRLFTLDAATGAVLGRTAVGGIPRGVALLDNESGAPSRAFVFNEGVSSVSIVDLSDPAAPSVTKTVQLDERSHPDVRAGRLAFNSALASSTETFSCESCHPDAHTDQLLWILNGPVCDLPGCLQIQPRSTMPARGLRDTLPLHWDGVPGDPYGGINGKTVNTDTEPNCTDEHSCFRHLVDGSMAGTMCDQDDCTTSENELGLAGRLSEAERDAMAVFLYSVPIFPARERPFDDDVTPLAEQGFADFFYNEGGTRSSCGQVAICHSMPFWNGTNTPGTGFDAPTFRGIQERWLTLPQGRSFIYDLMVIAQGSTIPPFDPDLGHDELSVWSMTFGTEERPAQNRASFGIGPMPSWQMFLEGGFGFSGALGRQVTLDAGTASGEARTSTELLLAALEAAGTDGSLVVAGRGMSQDSEVAYRFADGAWHGPGDAAISRDEMLDLAAAGDLVLTVTGRPGPNVDIDNPQPMLWSYPDSVHNARFRHYFPELPEENPFPLLGRHIRPGATLLLDGRTVDGTIGCAGEGQLPDCAGEEILVSLDRNPAPGQHLLQVLNPGGLLSNEFLVFMDASAPATGVQVTPGGESVLVSKDVVGERWAIVLNRDDGTATGNVFRPDGSEPAFVFCEPQPGVRTVYAFECFGADSCKEDTCATEDWVSLGRVEVPFSFFAPRPAGGSQDFEVTTAPEDGASGLRTTRDGRRTLVSKDAGGKRWAIQRNLSGGTVTGNVFDPAGGPAQFVFCTETGHANGTTTYACSGADACAAEPCEDTWVDLGAVELADSFWE